MARDHEVWLRCWLPGQWTGLHDHGGSVGAFAIARGEVRERTFKPAGCDAVVGVLTPGRVRVFAPRHIHDLINAPAAAAVSVHVRSPRLTETSRCDLAPAGVARAGAEPVDGVDAAQGAQP